MRTSAEIRLEMPQQAGLWALGLSWRKARADRCHDMSQWKGYGPDNVVPSPADLPDNGPLSAASAGALTYEPYYGLTAKPFSLSTDPRSLYKSPSHSAALEDLLTGIRRREGIVVLTGEMGTGKTTLCRAALYQLDRKTFTTFVPDPFLSREDLLRMLLVDFGEVSIDDLRRGRLSGASRPDLSYQLYEFLTSLESVDAFAVLVIDEAQHLAQPLLEEIRALSELEAGRRLLQIVLVGQPELQTSLKQFQMRQIDQRVTMRCELRPLTREDVAGYVAHRLAMVSGAKERIAFASAAIDLIHATSNGVPRLVNIICDRALSRAHHERLSVIGPPLVAGAIEELHLTSGRVVVSGHVVERAPALPAAPAIPVAPFDAAVPETVTPDPPAPVRVPPPVAAPTAAAAAASPASNRTGLFERRAVPVPESARATSELHALLGLATTTPKVAGPGMRDPARDWAPDQAKVGPSAAPLWSWRMESEVRRETRSMWLKNIGLAILGMGVLLLAGGIALTAQRGKPGQESITIAPQTTVAPPAAVVPAAAPEAAPAVAASAAAPADAAAITTPAAQDTWIVQVGAFSSQERSLDIVQRLRQAGFPAFEVPTPSGSGLLYFVRVGPFKTAGEADAVRANVGEFSDIDDAFVRSVSPPAP